MQSRAIFFAHMSVERHQCLTPAPMGLLCAQDALSMYVVLAVSKSTAYHLRQTCTIALIRSHCNSGTSGAIPAVTVNEDHTKARQYLRPIVLISSRG
jgi:hypothetical protein